MSDLKQFEDRNDDWLAKQRRLEQRISPWDLDDARKIKEEHAAKHQQYNQRQGEYRRSRQTRPPVSSNSGNALAKFVVVVVVVVFVITLLPLVLMTFRGNGVFSMCFMPLLFVIIVIILSSLGGRKRW